eukprot:245827_1
MSQQRKWVPRKKVKNQNDAIHCQQYSQNQTKQNNANFVYKKKMNMNIKHYTNHHVMCRDNDYNVIRVLSWNINADCHSKCASNEWIESNNKWQLMYSQITQQKPDIIALQELPKNSKTNVFLRKFTDTKEWYATRTFETMHVRDFSDGTILLIHKRLSKHYHIKYNGNNAYDNIDRLNKWPGVILWDKTTKRPALLLYSIHFCPSKSFYKERRHEFDELYSESIRNNMSDIFVCVGDTNMRENEELFIKNNYYIQSCWDIIPQRIKRNDYFTWHWNYFKPRNDWSLRYDRMFMSQKIQCKRLCIFDAPVSKNNEHFLSDHRGILITITLCNV